MLRKNRRLVNKETLEHYIKPHVTIDGGCEMDLKDARECCQNHELVKPLQNLG